MIEICDSRSNNMLDSGKHTKLKDFVETFSLSAMSDDGVRQFMNSGRK